MRRRPIRSAVALLAVLAQLVLGASALGLVVCSGRDHAGIELGSDECCAQAEHGAGTALEDRCCTDTPLFSAARRVSDVPRSASAPGPVLLALVPPVIPPAVATDGRRTAARDNADPDRLARRSIVLRV